jgi:esterase/lipase
MLSRDEVGLAGRGESLDVPIVLAQGRLDQVAPGEAAQRLYDSPTAPSKQLVWFERSAQTPQYDEPANSASCS